MSAMPWNRVRWLISASAGAVLPFAFAPFDQFWIAPLSFGALFYAWRDAQPWTAFRLGMVFGVASFGGGTYWTFIAVRIIGEAPFALAVFLSVALVLTLALFVAAAGYVAARWLTITGAVAWLVCLPALLVLGEWLRSWMLTGFGWLAAGYSQTDSWLMAYAPVAGIHAMSWAVLVSGGALLTLSHSAVQGRRSQGAAGARTVRGRGPAFAIAAAVGVLAAVWGVAGLLAERDWTEPKSRELRVALVQGAVPQTLKWLPEQFVGTLELYAELTRQSAGSELIIWPEAAVPTLYEYVGDYLATVKAQAAQRGGLVLLGILQRNPSPVAAQTFQNVLISLTDPVQIYVKRHLVPFGEYFPVPGFIRNWMRLMSLPYTDAVPGAPDQPPLDILGEKIAITICYEDVFGAEQLHSLPDATLLVNVSNDAWFGDSIAPHQHLQIARVRAAEAGRYLLRSTNTGVTAIIDPHGAIPATIPQFQAGVLEHTVRGYTGATPYARWGNYPVIVGALALLLAQWLLGLAARRRA